MIVSRHASFSKSIKLHCCTSLKTKTWIGSLMSNAGRTVLYPSLTNISLKNSIFEIQKSYARTNTKWNWKSSELRLLSEDSFRENARISVLAKLQRRWLASAKNSNDEERKDRGDALSEGEPIPYGSRVLLVDQKDRSFMFQIQQDGEYQVG